MMGNATLVDQSMATMAGSGAVSTFNYGTKIITMLLGVGSLALSTAALPHFSQMIAVKDWAGLRHTLKTYTRLIFGVSVPLMIGIMLFSEQIIGILFGRGAFTADDVYQAAQVQTMFALQIPFFVLTIFLVRVVSALRHNHFLTWGSGINLFLNIALNYLFVDFFGLKGIALSTAVVYSISWLYLSVVTRHLLRVYETAA
ncbi:MAG: oligosaccharide flippase family protein [Chloroflexaceae bacterium]|nr:oligosaccharide flippase family protein [Chloroflexaceae bacterium]